MTHPSDHTRSSGIRKAAVLVASLDAAEADALIEQLSAEQAVAVRQATIDLAEIDPREQRRLVDEFRRIRPMIPAQDPAGIELADRLAPAPRDLNAEPTASDFAFQQEAAGAPGAPGSFEFLQDAEVEKLASVLGDERPQTIALVLSQLSSERAAQLLGHLPAALQVDVIHRLVDLEETDPEVLEQVEQVLLVRLAQHGDRPRQATGMQTAADILGASGGPGAARILDNLAAHDGALAERLCPYPFDFDHLAQLDDAALHVVLQAIDPQWTMTALVGASARLTDRVLRFLPQHEAETVCRHLDDPGPIRLSDVERARHLIAENVRRLAAEGAIQLTYSHFTAAS